jgi:hypothetical protein
MLLHVNCLYNNPTSQIIFHSYTIVCSNVGTIVLIWYSHNNNIIENIIINTVIPEPTARSAVRGY